MIRDKAIGGRLVQGLRTKYFPKSRINQGLISVGPWVNIVLLIVMFMMLNNRLVVQSSYKIDLPAAGVDSGIRPNLVAVVRHFPPAGDFEAGERMFFKDESFLLGNARQIDALKARLSDVVGREAEASLLLYADKNISNDTLARIFNLLSEAGVESVSLAVLSD